MSLFSGKETKSDSERFPRSRTFSFEIGGKTGVQLETELTQSGVYVSSYAHDLLRSRDLQNPGKQENIKTILLRLQDAGIRDYVSWSQLVKQVKKEGLDLCPKPTGAYMRAAYTDQPEGEWVDVLSEPIAGRRGHPIVFGLLRVGGELGLYGNWTDDRWHPASLVVCRLR